MSGYTTLVDPCSINGHRWFKLQSYKVLCQCSKCGLIAEMTAADV